MIRKLKNNDIANVMKVLEKEPAFNLFAIGDIEVYGCEDSVVEVWTQSEDGEIIGVLLRYEKSFVLYFVHDDADAKDFAEIIKNHAVEADVISGKGTIIEKAKEYFDYAQHRKMYFCKLDKPIAKETVANQNAELASVEDAQGICDLQNSIDEFSAVATKEKEERNISEGFSRVYCIKNKDGDIISMAKTSAENSTAAMIVGVCTHVDYRRQGYVRKVMTRLCYDLQQENKLTCLFYDNKSAGKIYHSIGFETIGMWHMLIMNE